MSGGTSTWPVEGSGSSGGVTSLNSETGAIDITSIDNSVTITPSGQTIDLSVSGGGGTGNVVGPASATDNAITRFDGTTGKLIQNSTATLDDSGNLITAAAQFGGATAGASLNVQQSADGITTGIALYSQDGSQVMYLGQENGGNFFFFNGSNTPLIISGAMIGAGIAAPITRLESSFADPNTNITTIDLTSGIGIRNIDSTVGNMESLFFIDSTETVIASIIGVNTDQAGSGSLNFMTGHSGTLFNAMSIDQSAVVSMPAYSAGVATFGAGGAISSTAPGIAGNVLTSVGGVWASAAPATSGTVTAVTVVSANGLAGTSSGGATPALTLSTSITGILQGNGTAISAATTTGSGNVVLATAPTMTNPIVGTQSQGDSSTKGASTAYVDVAIANAVAGINPAIAVQAATTVAGDTSSLTYNNGASGIGATFTGATNTALIIDGFTFTTPGQRLLVKNDTQSPSGAFNGIYNVTQIQTSLLPPILTRALDYDQPSDMNNTGAIPVINGTVNGTTLWVLTSQVVTVGTTPLTFTKFGSSSATASLTVQTKSANYTILSTDDVIFASGTITLTLPAASGKKNPLWITNTGSGVITVNRAGSDTFSDGSTSLTISGTGSGAQLVSDQSSIWGLF